MCKCVSTIDCFDHVRSFLDDSTAWLYDEPMIVYKSSGEYPKTDVPVLWNTSARIWHSGHKEMPFSVTYPPPGINFLSVMWCASSFSSSLNEHIRHLFRSRLKTDDRNFSRISFFLLDMSIGAEHRTRTDLFWMETRSTTSIPVPHRLEQAAGLEPATTSLATRHSTAELHLH